MPTHLRPLVYPLMSLALLAAGCASPVPEPPDSGEAPPEAPEQSPPDAPADPQVESPAEGWVIYVTGPAGVEERHVAPDPALHDTDGDGLDDETERALRLDPTAADTDGDGLDDRFEVHELGSRADHIDSDGDAAGDPRFWDGGEVERIGSSPAMADTDGDGFDDRFEHVELRTDPRVADLPRLRIELESVPEIGLNTRLATGESDSITVDESATRSISMTQGESRAVQESIALSVGFGVNANAGLTDFGFGVSASTDLTTTSSVTLTLDRSYTEAAAATLGRARQRSASRELTIEGGYVAFPVSLENVGPVAFTLRNASMTLLHRDPRNPWIRRALSHLETADGRSAFPPRTLGPGDAHRNVYFRRDNLGWEDAAALIADPRGLEVEVSGYELVDGEGRAFAHDGTLRRTRTATLVIDRGPGRGEVERAVLATNLRLDPATGEPLGVAVDEALRSWLGHTFEVEVVEDAAGLPVRVLAALDGQRAEGSMHDDGPDRWTVVRVRGGVARPVVEDFDGIRLLPGDALHLVYDEDRDRDGLGIRTERALGTSDLERDTDGDGLEDGEEVLPGWAPGEPRPEAISDPTRADTDGDGLDDGAERAAGTDAFSPDTDGDGLGDAIDRAPLDVDRYTLEDLDARTIDGGAALELTWAPVASPGVEAIHIVREPGDDFGRFGALPDDILALDPADIADDLGGAVVARLGPGATRLVDAPPAEADVWRYLAFVRYAGVGLLPAGQWVIEHDHVQRFDRVQVALERLTLVGSDDCTVHWEMAVSAVGAADSQRAASPGGVRMEGGAVSLAGADPAYVAGQAVVAEGGEGLEMSLRMWRTSSFGGSDRLNSHTVHHDAGDDGARFTLAFDQISDPGECRVDVTYRVDVIERGLVDPGAP